MTKAAKYLILIIWTSAGLLVSSFSSHAQNGQALIQKAADAYGNADYQQAIDLYEQVLAGGEEAFELYYNLGNAYFKADQIAPAILNYERAARLDPADTDLNHNLAMARQRTTDKIETISVPEFVSVFKSYVNALSVDQWGIASILCFILLLAAAGAFLLSPLKWVKQLGLGSGLLLAALTTLFLLFAWQQKSWLDSRREAVIFQPSATVQSTPDNAGEELFVLHEGTKVRIVERFRDWVRIRIGDGENGLACRFGNGRDLIDHKRLQPPTNESKRLVPAREATGQYIGCKRTVAKFYYCTYIRLL